MRKASRKEVSQAIQGGIVFHRCTTEPTDDKKRTKTKAKKKAYITGAHGSASAKKKAAIRQARAKRANRRANKTR